MQWERVRPDSVVNGLNDMLSRQRTVTGPLNQTFEELRGVVDAFFASRWRHDVSSVHTSRSPRRVYGVPPPATDYGRRTIHPDFTNSLATNILGRADSNTNRGHAKFRRFAG